MPDSKALGIVWDVENDQFKICFDKKLTDVTTRRQMASQLASSFDPLGIASPCLLGGKLILQKAAMVKLDWDDELPGDIVNEWNSWVSSLGTLSSFSLDRYCFVNTKVPDENDNVTYQLHGFCDASNTAFSCVIYLRRIVNGRSDVSFIFGKSRVVLSHQQNWVISRKELEAAKLCSNLMLLALTALQHLSCAVKFWTDSEVLLKWITNPDLHLSRFIKRRIDKIHLVSSPESWGYIGTLQNPAHVGTRKKNIKSKDAFNIWLKGPEFLLQDVEDPSPVPSASAVRAISVPAQLKISENNDGSLHHLIKIAPDL